MMFVTPNSTKSGNKCQQPESTIIRNPPPGLHYWGTEPSLISENNPTRQLRPNLMTPKLNLNPGEPFEKEEENIIEKDDAL
jgi:hypothetical protein